MITKQLVQKLVQQQIPQWHHLPIEQIIPGGWDNRTFCLGNNLILRMPSAEKYAAQINKEFQWLPIFAPLLPVAIPSPVFLGKPSEEYPFTWSVYSWLEGETVAASKNYNLCTLAESLAHFLSMLHKIDTTHGPVPGEHNFFRGGSLDVYDEQTRHAISLLKNDIDAAKATHIWEQAIARNWEKAPVWVHGDIAAGNLLVQNDKLSGVIDFGLLAVGDPACDLAISWTLFDAKNRQIFREKLELDDATWDRARGWALWKALIVAAKITKSNAIEMEQCWHTIKQIFDDIAA